MLTVLETTVWSTPTPNHKYIVSDDMRTMFGYIKVGDRLPTLFSKPMSFDIRGRKFVRLVQTTDVSSETSTWHITGSRGDKYTITRRNGKYKCTCPVFTYRAQECKHIATIKANDSNTNS